MRPESCRPFLRWAWILCLLALAALPIQAQTLNITKVTDINAGSVVAPSSGTATYTLTYAGDRSIISGDLGSTAGLILGSFTIAGRSNRSFTLANKPLLLHQPLPLHHPVVLKLPRLMLVFQQVLT